MQLSTSRNVRFLSFITALTALSTNAAAQSDAPGSYHVVVIEDSAQGEQLIERDFESAISQLTPLQLSKSATFAEVNNLCVAHILARNIEAAKGVCENAVSHAERSTKGSFDTARPNARRDYAISLVNRGVLQALTGEAQGARLDFERAHRSYRTLHEPVANLQRLDANSSARVAGL